MAHMNFIMCLICLPMPAAEGCSLANRLGPWYVCTIRYITYSFITALVLMTTYSFVFFLHYPLCIKIEHSHQTKIPLLHLFQIYQNFRLSLYQHCSLEKNVHNTVAPLLCTSIWNNCLFPNLGQYDSLKCSLLLFWVTTLVTTLPNY